jgi:hypothetical protein
MVSVFVLLSGCAGPGGLPVGAAPPDAGGPSTPGPDGGAPPGSEIPPLPDRSSVPGPVALRRLTLLEYNNTVRDLVGAGAPVFSSGRLGQDQVNWSSFSRGAAVGTAYDARELMLAAEEIAEAAVDNLPALLPCSMPLQSRADEDACADQFIAGFGLRAYRRPLGPAERDKLRALYQRHRGAEIAGSFSEAIGDVVAAMLEAPEFLYRGERGAAAPVMDGALVRFDGYQLASRLSYLFWDSMPDEALFAAAAGGKLDTTTQLVGQARRLLADPRAADAVKDFHLQLVEADGLDEMQKDPIFPGFNRALARAMIDETRAFAASVYVGPRADGKLRTLLTSPTAFLDGPLARFYGAPEPAGGAPVSLPADQRAGLLTRAAFLASHADASGTNPVRRGDTVLRRLLCLSMPEPANIDIPNIPEPHATDTTRQRFEAHGRLACAAECHQKIVDPLGYAFEHYDAIGAWRTTDNGQPVDSHATVVFPSERIEFDDAVALSGILAQRPQVRDCMSAHWLRYLLRRQELPQESATVDALAAFYRQADDLRELMVAVVRSKTFTHRSLSRGEGP